MNSDHPKLTNERLVSLDFFRGATMFLLIAEFASLFPLFLAPEAEGTPLHFLGVQLHHREWEGLNFWDLIQPFFMFIVGVSMPLSLTRRAAQGDTVRQITFHVLKRSLLLLVLGWALYCIEPGRITFRFQNVLAQLSFTYLVAYILMKKKPWVQILVSVLLVAVSEGLYRYFWVDGFTHPFTADQNFGAWVNLMISGELDGGHWAIFNAVPTAAHTIWGVLAGQLLMSNRPWRRKILILVIAGLTGLALGYGLSPVTPIIKRIATSTFIFAGGGWTLLTLALCYWVIDVLKFRKVLFFSVVGMNPLFIYLFSHVGGANLLRSCVWPFTNGLFSRTGEWLTGLITGLTVLFLLWFICWWMYKRKVFIRI